MIRLNDLLNLSKDDLKNTKIRFMVRSDVSGDPHQVYIDNPYEVTNKWFLWEQEKQTAFHEDNIAIGFIRIGKDRWLLVTAQRILKCINKKPGVNYEAEIITEFQKYFGRIIVKFHNTSENLCRWANRIIDNIEITEILPDKYEGKIFPGYENVTISWYELKTIIDNQKTDWITALKNQKGVYLITDTKTGRLYVGSAYGEEMLLQRWTCYKETGHGYNKKLKELKKEYIQENFQYSILETYNNTTPDDRIRNREQWWKRALKTIEHGYNDG